MKKKSEKAIKLEKEMSRANELRAAYVSMGCGGLNGIIAAAAWVSTTVDEAKAAIGGKVF